MPSDYRNLTEHRNAQKMKHAIVKIKPDHANSVITKDVDSNSKSRQRKHFFHRAPVGLRGRNKASFLRLSTSGKLRDTVHSNGVHMAVKLLLLLHRTNQLSNQPDNRAKHQCSNQDKQAARQQQHQSISTIITTTATATATVQSQFN